jgi:hypothetical protein
MIRATLAILFASLLVFACARGDVTRSDWERMSPDEKLLIIEAFRGHEASREAKGGGGRLHPRPSEEYRERIDALYRGGDQRTVAEIWDDLVEPRMASPAPAE